MKGRHYAGMRAANPDNPVPEGDTAHVMRELPGGDVAVTWYPLPYADAVIHADSLSQNDADNLRARGAVEV